MNRQEAQRRKRLLRDIANRTRAALKLQPSAENIRVIALPSRLARQYARKRVPEFVTATFADAWKQLPASWKGRMRIHLQAGNHPIPSWKES
jgi:hypothetical protein